VIKAWYKPAMSDVWSLAPYRTAGTPTIGSAMRRASGFQGLSSGCLAGSTGSRAFGPATPGHTELFARQPASSPIMMRLPRPMAARTTKLYGPP